MKTNTNIFWDFLRGGLWFPLTVLNMHLKRIGDLLPVCVCVCVLLFAAYWPPKQLPPDKVRSFFSNWGYFGWSHNNVGGGGGGLEGLPFSLGLRLELGIDWVNVSARMVA